MKHILLSRSIFDQDYMVDACKDILKKEDKVVVLLYSFFQRFMPSKAQYDAYYQPNGEYDLKVRKLFEPYGIHDISYIHYYDQDHAHKKMRIQQASVLYFPGGAPDEMMSRFDEHGLIDVLKAFKGVTIGSSAGAMIHLTRYHIYKDREYNKFSFQEGLGYVEGFDIVVHYNRKIQQKKAIRKVYKTYKTPLYVIPDDGGMIIEDNKIRCIASAKLLIDRKGKRQ
jgi:peptidase E